VFFELLITPIERVIGSFSSCSIQLNSRYPAFVPLAVYVNERGARDLEGGSEGVSIAAYIAAELHRLRTIESLVTGKDSINISAMNIVTPKTKETAQNCKITNAGGVIRTREPLREQILSLPPLSTR
jgi:hypothetical protein